MSPAFALAQGEVAYDIPSQDLGTALTQFGQQSQREIVFSADLTRNRRAPQVSGQFSPEEALAQLLANSGLSYRITPSGSIIVQQEGGSGPQSQSAAGDGADVDALIVTAQKKEEAIQDVPIAISAFTQKSLDDQKIEGGYDLLKAVPNVTFSKSNYSSYNFSIRGVGTKAVSATSDPGVAVAFNNISLLRNRLYEQEYFDVERVEVLRGPQGTLYGRNATGGVVNMITAKARQNEFLGQVKAEIGNYDARRVSGYVNLPILEDRLAIRVAGAMTQRDGYGINLTTNEPADSRDLWSGRISVNVQPTDRIRADFIWEHFEEDDARLRTGKQLCHHDAGPVTVAGVTGGPLDMYGRGKLSQGCKIGSLYDAGALGTPNGWSLPFTLILATDLGQLGTTLPDNNPLKRTVPLMKRGVDPYGNRTQSSDLRAIESIIEPEYRAKADIFALNVELDVTDTLTFTSQTAYNEDEVWSLQDYMRFATGTAFNDSSVLYGLPWNEGGGLLLNVGTTADIPGGVYTDPQIGPSNTLKGFEISSSESTQFSQEFRLQSAFDGPLNFSVGANYLRFRGVNDYYLFFNVLTLLAEAYYNGGDPYNQGVGNHVYVDSSPFDALDGDGHNYFRNQNPYKLDSTALFGELYWEATDSLKITAGVRYSDDRKIFTPWPSHLLVQNVLGSKYGPEADIKLDWQEFTGRLGVDWKPDLPFTDESMLYAFYSRGYKGGGANPPPAKNPNPLLQAVTPAVFDPEYVDAFEIGAKNTLLQGSLTLNGAAFYYDYKDYQVSKVQDRTVVNEGFDAVMWGVELEALWRPTRELRLNANLGYLNTRIADGEKSLDIFNRVQDEPGWMLATPWPQQTSNCVLPTAYIAEQINNYRLLPPIEHERFGGDGGGLLTACLNFWIDPANVAANPDANTGQGFLADVSGNDLPNSPHLTVSLGAEYTIALPGGWETTVRGDYYRQSQSWSRVYAEVSDKLRGWENANLSLTFARPDSELTVQLYAKNLFEETPITDAFLNSDSTGMTTNIFVLDPRLIGLSVRKGF